MKLLLFSIFYFIDFLLVFSFVSIIKILKNLIIKTIKSQLLIILITFITCYFYFDINLITSFNLSQTSLSKALFGITSESILSHCNSNTELLGFGLMFIGTYLTYRYFFNPFILKPAYSFIIDSNQPTPIYGDEILLSSYNQRLNLNREDLKDLITRYYAELSLITKKIENQAIYDLDLITTFFEENPHHQYVYTIFLLEHKKLHTELLPFINPNCITNFAGFALPLRATEAITFQLICDINKRKIEEVVLSDLYGITSERMNQIRSIVPPAKNSLAENLNQTFFGTPVSLNPFVIIPPEIIPIRPIIGQADNITSRTFDVPATYTNIWEYYIVPALHYIGSFF